MSSVADRITHDLLEKIEQTYALVERLHMWRFGEFGEWLPDSSLDSLTPHRLKFCDAFTNPADAMERVAVLYRKALLADADVRFEIWVETKKESPIAGLYACRGFATLTFIHDVAEAIQYLGAYDAGGADDRIAEILARLANEPILAQRLAVLPKRIAAWPETPLVERAGFSVDPPDHLHDHVRQVIEKHLPYEEFKILKIARESDNQVQFKWVLS